MPSLPPSSTPPGGDPKPRRPAAPRGGAQAGSGTPGAPAWGMPGPDRPKNGVPDHTASGSGEAAGDSGPDASKPGTGRAAAARAGSKPAPNSPRCGVCGTESRQPRPRPVAPEQAPDLDLRPGEPLRSTMEFWLQQCPHCGYSAPDIARAHPAVAQAVAAAPFRALVNDTAHPLLARRFLAWAHVLEESGALHAAAEATLQAAWVADDEAMPELARTWRLEAVALWRSGPPLSQEQSVRVVDALRRAGAWDDAASSCRNAQAGLSASPGGGLPSDPATQVLGLEARLIAAHDDGRHTLASALPPPARRPHVTHQGSSSEAPPPRRDGSAGDGLLGRLRRWLGRS
ncbi:hypothetical protein [Roseomonas elaeocarpi]|uniref:Uncharacterized protein n=1 Tax=Roseomonas elaeocarpi TaxID=907779 RepID=A0ABV6JR00_9PROT